MKIQSVVYRMCLAVVISTGVAAVAEARDDVLVLGDSLAFSYIASPGYEYFYINPENFVGFPDYVGDMLHTDVVNASCPGESTGSFLSATALDNGCRLYRKYFPLHVDYGATQLEFTKYYLKRHHDVRLVTVTLGANDELLLLQGCAYDPGCIERGATAMVTTVAANIGTILADLRATGYRAGP